MKNLHIFAMAWLLPFSGLLGEEVADKPNPPREGGNLAAETGETMKVVGELRIAGAATLPPCFVVGKTVKWRGLPILSQSQRGHGSGRIKSIAGGWVLIEVIIPDNAFGTWWVYVPSAQFAWSAEE